MKRGLKFFSLALCACAFAACSDDLNDGGSGGGGSQGGDGVADGYSYVVASSSGELGYLQQVDDIAGGMLDATQNTNNRIVVEGNMDFVQVGGYLLNMNYAAHSSDGISTLSYSYEIADGALTRRSPMDLEGDVKARGTYGEQYLIGASSQDDTSNDCYYERIKIVDVKGQKVINNNGRITLDKNSDEYKAVGEFVQFSDIAQFGDYVLVSYTTKQETPSEDAAAQQTRKPSTTTTQRAKNTYVGVYAFDPADSEKEYLKFKGLLKAEAKDGVEYGQIRGNSASRTETGIEPLDDGSAIYYFCQGGSSNKGESTVAPSVLLRTSGSNIQNGMPVAFDDFRVDLLEKTGGYFVWRVYYLGGTKFCLQLFTDKGVSTGKGVAHSRFGIYDVSDNSYKEVTGINPADIEDVALCVLVEKDKGTVTFAMQPTTGKAFLCTIDSTGEAKRGLEVNAESISGIARVTNWKYAK